MIQKIGLIYQDAISLGVLIGLQRRLQCDAQLLFASAAVGRSTMMTGRQATIAYRGFIAGGADLIVRLTDADGNRWQDVKRNELEAFPPEAHSLLVCGVAERNIEHWLGISCSSLERALGLSNGQIDCAVDRSAFIKGAIHRAAPRTSTKSDFVAEYVERMSTEEFKMWLQHNDFGDFYDGLRSSAAQHQCAVTNER